MRAVSAPASREPTMKAAVRDLCSGFHCWHCTFSIVCGKLYGDRREADSVNIKRRFMPYSKKI